MLIEKMFGIGICFLVVAVCCLVIGTVLSFFQPDVIINKQLTLTGKWFVTSLAFTVIAAVWMYQGWVLTM